MGQGSCHLVKWPGPTILYDFGSSKHPPNKSKQDILAEISVRLKDCQQLDPNQEDTLYIFISHADKDHAHWLPDLMEEVNWRGNIKIIYGGTLQQYKKSVQEWISSYEQIQAGPGVQNPEIFRVDTSILTILHSKEADDTNQTSIILQIQWEGFSVIFTGDAEGTNTDEVVDNQGSSLKATIVTACHHGAETNYSNNKKWIKAVDAEYVVFSCAKHNGFHHPRYRIARRYLENGNRLSNTDEHTISLAKCQGNKPTPHLKTAIPANEWPDGDWLPFETQKGLYSTLDCGHFCLDLTPNAGVKLNTF